MTHVEKRMWERGREKKELKWCCCQFTYVISNAHASAVKNRTELLSLKAKLEPWRKKKWKNPRLTLKEEPKPYLENRISYRACLHLVTSCLFSDLICIWFFHLPWPHKCLCKTDINPFFNCRAMCKFTLMKAIDMHCILLIISSFQYQRPQQKRVRHQHWKDRLVSLLLMKIIVCWLTFSLILCSLCVGLLKRYSVTHPRWCLLY